MPFCSFEDVDADSGLGGRLVTLAAPLGGRGKEPMLLVFLTVFGMPEPIGGEGEGAGRASLVDRVGTADVELALAGLFGVGRPEIVTAREGMDVFFDEGGGILEAVEVRLDSAAAPSSLYLRVLETGKAGSGPVGGGRGVLGPERVDAMMGWLFGYMRSCGGRCAYLQQLLAAVGQCAVRQRRLVTSPCGWPSRPRG